MQSIEPSTLIRLHVLGTKSKDSLALCIDPYFLLRCKNATK